MTGGHWQVPATQIFGGAQSPGVVQITFSWQTLLWQLYPIAQIGHVRVPPQPSEI